MDDDSRVTPEDDAQTTDWATQPAPTTLDIEALADRVYRLMVAEVRLTRVRLGELSGRGALSHVG